MTKTPDEYTYEKEEKREKKALTHRLLNNKALPNHSLKQIFTHRVMCKQIVLCNHCG